MPLDLLEYSNIDNTINEIKPDEIYNLAAQSFVATSFQQPLYTSDVDGLGTARLLEIIRQHHQHVRFYQASTSEMFGKAQTIPQTEKTPFYPRSPYGISKLYAHWMTVNYREAYGLHVSSGILFNHELPLRGEEFVTRKITLGLSRIFCGQEAVLELGNIDTKHDWGYAKEYVEGMWLMLQQDSPGDYVLCSGENHSIREFIEIAAKCLGYAIKWEGSGINEIGIDVKSGKTLIKINPKYHRPSEVYELPGDSSRARKILGWKHKTTFDQLVEIMISADIKYIRTLNYYKELFCTGKTDTVLGVGMV